MSTKFDSRLDKLEEKIVAFGQLPASARGPYLGWGECEERFDEIKKELTARYGTWDGADFICLRWGTPQKT